MKKQKRELTNEEMLALKTAENEKHFKKTALLKEIKPLLEDYFLGEFNYSNGVLSCNFPNGQKIKLFAN